MTNEQRNQVAAMNASGMSIDEIVLDSGHSVSQTAQAECQALEAARKKLLAIYETLTPEETRAWELGEVYAEVVRGLGE